MLSCRRVKGPLIFVSVLMHRETNLQVENEETIEAQSARPQSAVGRNPTALFHLVREFPSMVQVSGAAFLAPAFCIASSASRPVPPFLPIPASRSPRARSRVHAVRANPVGVRKTGPLHSAFADRAVGKIGRQFSYKHNAEEGVRLDEKRGTMDRGTKGGWRRSFGVGHASVCPGCREPSCGSRARSGAMCEQGGFRGRCVRIGCAVRIRMRLCLPVRMNCRVSDAPSARGAEPGPTSRFSGDRCVRIDRRPSNAAFLRFLHPDDIAATHRGGRATASVRALARERMVSPGRDRGAGVSRENERRRGAGR